MRREAVVGVLAMMMVLVLVAETRYLPTRAQDDKLLRLRQLLRDLLENDVEPQVEPVEHRLSGGYEPRVYKREAVPYDRPIHYLH